MKTRLVLAFSAFGLLLATLGLVPPCPACPFCAAQGQTLTKEVNQAAFVVFGTMQNPRLGADGIEGTTELVIEDIVKPHPVLNDKKVLSLPRYIPASKVKFLVFCDYFKERVDPYRGIPIKEKDIATYLKGATSLDEKDVPTRLEFFFPYMEHAEAEISTDAYKEFAAADAKDVLVFIEKTDRARMRASLEQWLRNPDTGAYKFGLYGYLLGLCGTPEDADVLLDLLNDPARGLVSGIDGVLAGYITLQPKEGWSYLTELLNRPKSDFTRRYAALRTLRFFWEYPNPHISKKDVLTAMSVLLDQGDIADLAIEDLRKWQQWDQLDKVLSLAKLESHAVPIVQRAILRYALSSEEDRAKSYVEEVRKKDPHRVKDVEELLRLDQPLKPPMGNGTK
jgi:hypothetical protein